MSIYLDVKLLKKRLYRKVRLIIAEQLCVDLKDVTPTAHFIEDLNADSLDLVELIMSLEGKFHIDIPDDEAANINTLDDSVKFIQEKIIEQNVQTLLEEDKFWDEFDSREL